MQDFEAIVRPYFMQRKGDARWEIRMRILHLQRYSSFLKRDFKIQRQNTMIKTLSDKLSEEAKVPYGASLLWVLQMQLLIYEYYD